MSHAPEHTLSRRSFLQGLAAAQLVLTGALPAVACDGRDKTFYFAVLSDIHLHDDPEHPNAVVLAQTIDILNGFEVPIDFVLLPGDLVDEVPSEDRAYYTEHTDTSLHLLREMLDHLDMPWHAVMGNHDYFVDFAGYENHIAEDKEAVEEAFVDVLGVPGLWFGFEHQGIAFYALNSMQDDARVSWEPDRVGSFGEDQLAWLEDQLADGLPCFLTFHHPLALDNVVEAGLSFLFPFEIPRAEGGYSKYEGTEFEGWTDPIYELIERHAEQILGIFVGHGHWFVEDHLHGIPVLMTDSVGNSVQQTSETVGGEQQPMRYHIVECDPRQRTFSVYNLSSFEYNL